MSSIIHRLSTDFPQLVVLGATGRLGGILRAVWGQAPAVRWQTRGAATPGLVSCALEAPVLEPLLRDVQGVLVLAGPAGVTAQGQWAHAAIARAVLAAAPAQARLLFASSAAVYGAARGLLTETTQPAPLSDYGRAKLEMEALLADVPQACALRIGNVAGADAILGGWAPGFRLDRFADHRTPRRSYIGPLSLARVLADLITHSGPLPPVLNVAAPGVVEMGALLDAAGLDWTPRPAPETALPEVALCTRALERYTAFAPEESTPEDMVAQVRRVEAQ